MEVQIEQANLTQIKHLAKDWIHAACILDAKQRGDGTHRKGGYLCVADKSGILLLQKVGEIADKEQEIIFRRFCQEKARRLLKNIKRGHICSRQSQNEKKQQYPGAVLARDGRAFSFSGLTGEVDEAFSALLAARSTSGMNDKVWYDIQKVGGNPHMKKFALLKGRVKEVF